MKKENRKYFVYYGNKTVATGKLLVRGTLSMAFFAAVALFVGFMTNERTKAVAVVLLCYTVVYIIANLFLAVKVKSRLINQCLTKGEFLIATSIFFLMVSVMVSQAFDNALQMTALFVGGYFGFMGLCLIISKFFIDRGAFRNRKDVQRKNIWMFSLGGTLLGISLSRTFGPLLSQNAIYMVFAVGSYIIAVMCTSGVMHWMKYYFIRKYGFEDVEIDAESD